MKYDANSNGLVFDGVDDYLELEKPGNFSKGFTFEYYGTFDRWLYTNEGRPSSETGCPLFCKTKDLFGYPGDALRFGFAKHSTKEYWVCKVIQDWDACGNGKNLYVLNDNGTVMVKDGVYDKKHIGDEVYITVTYEVGGGSKVNGEVERIG